MEKNIYKNLMIATDGSDCAKSAFKQAIEFFENSNLFECIIVGHISNKKKTYLAEKYTPEYIYNDYKTELLSLYPADKYKLVFEEKAEDQPNVNDQLLQLAEKMLASFLIIGYSGRKGQKNDPTVLCQTVKHTAYHSQIPLVIIKQLYLRKDATTQGFTYLACVDGSKKGYNAMDSAFKLATSKNDKVVVLYSPSPDKEKFVNTIKAEVTEILKSQKQVKWEFVSLKPTYDQADSIVQFINLDGKYDIQFVFVGNNGYRAQTENKSFFGRVAETILTKALSNIVVISI